MRRIRTALCVMAVLLLALAARGMAEEVILDVVDGELRVQSYRVALADTQTPVKIEEKDDQVWLRVVTPAGEVEIGLGEVTLRATERGARYIANPPKAVPTETSKPRGERKCSLCGAPAKDHACPRCKSPLCAHDDIKCGYRLNPAPTQFKTTGPDGKSATWYVAEDGSYAIGVPPGHKFEQWDPGKDYMEARATPTPSPTPWPTLEP